MVRYVVRPLFSVLPLFAAALLLTACGGEAGSDSANSGSQAPAAPAATPADTQPKPATAAATAAGTSKPAPTPEKPTAEPVAAAKPAAPKPAPKTTTPSTPAPKPEPAAIADDPFSLVEAMMTAVASLPTFNNDLDDLEVSPRRVERWAAPAREYVGTYYGPLGSEVASVQVTSAGGGNLNLVFGYQAEVVSDDGMIDQKQGEQAARGIQPQGSILQWSRVPNVYVTQGQFVRWDNQYGLLLQGTAPGKPGYLLMRKVKSR